MKLTLKGAAKKCHAIWSKCVRARDGKCLLCGSTGSLDAHHGVAARGNGVRAHWFMLENGFSLCFQCHMLVHSRIGSKDRWERWLKLVDEMVSQEKQTEIIRAKNTTTKYTIEDLEGVYENLAKEYDRITGI